MMMSDQNRLDAVLLFRFQRGSDGAGVDCQYIVYQQTGQSSGRGFCVVTA
jgi:hypothetical protein